MYIFINLFIYNLQAKARCATDSRVSEPINW